MHAQGSRLCPHVEGAALGPYLFHSKLHIWKVFLRQLYTAVLFEGILFPALLCQHRIRSILSPIISKSNSWPYWPSDQGGSPRARQQVPLIAHSESHHATL